MVQVKKDAEEGDSLVGEFDDDGEKVAKAGTNFRRGQCCVGRKCSGSSYSKQSMLIPPGPII